MKRILLLVSLVALLFIGAKCQSVPAPEPRIPVVTPDAAPIIAGQLQKDKTVVESADEVDAIVEKGAPEVAAPVKVQTDQIRAAVAANPAEDVAALVASFDTALNLLRDQLKEADARTARAEKLAEKLTDAEMKATARSLRGGALAALVLAGLLGYSGQPMWALACGIGAILAFGLAQLVSQPWFMPACTVAVALILIGCFWAAIHAYRKNELAAKVEKEATKLKATLGRVVPAVDAVRDELDAAAKKLLEDTLGRFMDKEHKQVIKDVRNGAS